MNENSKQSFWATLPGVLAAVAGVITAVGALVVSLAQIGVIGKKPAADSSSQNAPAVASVAATQPARSSAPGDIILGTWEQYIFTSPTDLVFGGTFVVSKVDDGYVMGAQQQTPRPDLVNSLGLTNVTSDGTVWTFQSHFTDGESGEFRLRRVSDSIFEGEVVQGGRVTRNKWVRRTHPTS
jgi:hypothetical protein